MNNQTLSLIDCLLICIATTTTTAFNHFFAINALGLEHYGHLVLIGIYVLTISVVINWSMYTNCEDSCKSTTYTIEAEVMTK